MNRVAIVGAAGRDFHNFNVVFRDNKDYRVVAFTAAQIPGIDDRRYPPELAGSLYPEGIPIFPEEELEQLIKEQDIDTVVFSYSDVSYSHVMHIASRAMAAGADFRLLSAHRTQIRSNVPVVSICAVRTGCGKSQTTRRVAEILSGMGLKLAAIRHPMPYGNLVEQAVQRFASVEDMDRHDCTIEEREEYEPHVVMGTVVYAGVDYGRIVAQAETEAEVILWDGGNNDTPFYHSDLEIVVTDPFRPGHGLAYFPGEENLRRADVAVINKVNSAPREGVQKVRESIRSVNPNAQIIEADSLVHVTDPALLQGKRVLVIEDGPTLTHGGMEFGAGVVAARQHGAAELVDPRPYAVGTIKATYEKYSHLSNLLPAMGYGAEQCQELEQTIDATPCDVVLVATPIDLGRIIRISKPSVRATYELKEREEPGLTGILSKFTREHELKPV